MSFKKAERHQAKLKIGMAGPSGSGKTYSSLVLASAFGKKIALIDTEAGSASLYADKFQFDTMDLKPPYTVDKYIDAIKSAEDGGYDVLVIDSISHQWAGEGGILSRKEQIDSRGGNSFTNWSQLTPEQERFKSKILNANIHMVCTMRSKQDYVIESNDKGKMAPKKVGMAPVQREGMEYELTTVFDIGMDHRASVSKDRTGLFDNQIFKITKDTGKLFMDWLKGAKIVPSEADQLKKTIEQMLVKVKDEKLIKRTNELLSAKDTSLEVLTNVEKTLKTMTTEGMNA